MNFTYKDHTFVLCAYKENSNLEEAILSLINQKVKTNVIVSTSTPNDFINGMCKKYNLPLFINPNPESIASDWNFGYMQAKTKLITIAHQDDFYEPDYSEKILEYANKRPDALIVFSDYYELRNTEPVHTNSLLRIKRIMNFPLRFSIFWRSRFIRRRILAFGNSICCPSVTFIRENAGSNVYDVRYKNSCDYMTWTILADKKGSFVYIPKQLMAHRIYEGSTTTLNIHENIRQQEDYEILSLYWPKWISKLIYKFYIKGQDSNEV